MSTQSTSPILATAPVVAHVIVEGAGADVAPGDIVALTCTVDGPHTLRIALGGQADHYSVSPLRKTLGMASALGYRDLVLDCRALDFCDSALLRVLDAWHHSGGTCTVVRPPAQLERMLDILPTCHRPLRIASEYDSVLPELPDEYDSVPSEYESAADAGAALPHEVGACR
ncbi:STAS domain-containing protein [Streptomyces sp. NPDC001941]|uniref:STAS domain-containing protein n=1 Tax=Streptomyces sp. NPDC001941 TaxID=3154659 RepID=UPI0033313837